MKLIILFVVGIILLGIFVYMAFDNPQEIAKNPMLIFVGGIGFFLVILSVTKAMKKANRYLDK